MFELKSMIYKCIELLDDFSKWNNCLLVWEFSNCFFLEIIICEWMNGKNSNYFNKIIKYFRSTVNLFSVKKKD